MNSLATPALAAGIMDLNPGLTLWVAITFLFLIGVLAKFAFGPIVRMLDERERIIRAAIEQARKEADDLVASARHQIEEEKVKAVAEIKGQTVDLAIAAAGRILKVGLDDKAQRALVEEYIAQLPASRS